MPIGGSSSRSGRLARISQSNIRPFGSNGGTSNTTFGPGSHPMVGAEPSSPTKTQPKHRFEITKKLGSGTYGKVSLAYDHKFDREVAVKLIKKSAIENKADLVRIRREIRIMSALNHPNIIQIYEVFENKDKIILVMEYSNGGELYDYVSRCGSLPECEARRIFRQITSAVLYCHKHKVAHRDLKLENILLDQDNNAKIADFGLSNYFNEKNLLTTFCGSPLYASPEIINGTPYKGPEVDCWSLGILLYTLVYGSMPFDGRDFNRMVRQIKRGAYYEPETPSTASMLIRNMLRVNPDRRATIFDIASHWWLNLEENMPVIQELPENQIIDHTPLTERAETMVVQDLADEQDVFMEFGHLSNETRKKIEDFRRRRKEAEEFNENSPIKPPKKKKEENAAPSEDLRAVDKSLRGKEENPKVDTNDPLERLRQIENRLGQSKKAHAEAAAAEAKKREEKRKEAERKKTPEQPEDPKTARESTSSRKASDVRAPSFVPVTEKATERKETTTTSRPFLTASNYRIETDSLNMLMNQVLEQMEKGPVSLNIVARIKAHPLYDTRPMVKELLESIISAQPESVKRQASKVIEKKSESISRNNTLTRRRPSEPEKVPAPPSPPTHERRHQMGVRPWNSVEVGFDPEEDEQNDVSVMQASIASTATEVTVQDTSFEDSEDEEVKQKTPVPPSPKTPTVPIVEIPQKSESNSDDEEEYSDSEMEELADEVEKKNPATEAAIAASLEANPPPDPSSSPQYLDAFDRRLTKRQSKGKYQHTLITNYGRGVSTECESPTQQKKFFGGPQPTAKLSPYLFDKAKELVMQFPKIDQKMDLEMRRKKKMEKVKADLLAQPKDLDKQRTIYVGSVPPRSPPPIVVKSDGEEIDDDDDEDEEDEEEMEEEEEEEEEESETEVENIRPRRAIIAAVRTDDGVVLTPPSTSQPTTVASYKPNFQVSSVSSSQAPDSVNSNNNAKYLVTVAELRMKPNNGNEMNLSKREAELKEELKDVELPTPRKPNSTVVVQPPKDKSPTPEANKDEKEGWESAAAFIRRKNRERRMRNRTIGTAEEAHRALERPSVERFEDRAFSPAVGDAYYTGAHGYTRTRYEDSFNRPLSPTRHTSAAVNREERGKSHSTDPNNDYRTAYDRTSYMAPNASPSYGRKFEEPTSLNSWASEPRRFEVYKTRAERDAERNTYAPPPANTSAYKTSYYSDRPTSIIGSRAAARNDDYAYRSNTPGTNDYGYSSTLTEQSNQTRFRPSARRVSSALTEADKRAYSRSRSMDRNKAEGDYTVNPRARLTTPDAPDYSYVNYHDTSGVRTASTLEKDGQPRSILKNKQADTEPRVDYEPTGGVRSMFDRLRRHLSLEKSTSPQRQITNAPPTRTTLGGVRDTQIPSSSDNPKKKRSLLSFNRRKTSEVRLGPDGKYITTSGYDDRDRDYNRPSSPIDRIKSFFRKSDAPTTSTQYEYSRGYPSSSISTASTSTREPYVAQYRKYPGSTSARDPMTSYNRYSYTPGLNDQRRHWYDDSGNY